MRIREMARLGAWPPQWWASCHTINDSAILIGVRPIFGTDLLRIDVDHNCMPYLGTILVERELRQALYEILQENVGRPLGDIAELEMASGPAEAGARME